MDKVTPISLYITCQHCQRSKLLARKDFVWRCNDCGDLFSRFLFDHRRCPNHMLILHEEEEKEGENLTPTRSSEMGIPKAYTPEEFTHIEEARKRSISHKKAFENFALDLTCYLVEQGHINEAEKISVYEITSYAEGWFKQHKEWHGMD